MLKATLLALCCTAFLLATASAEEPPQPVADPVAEQSDATADQTLQLESISSELDEAGTELFAKYFSREVTILAADGIEIPFEYPGRPTITASIGGNDYPLLFDSGTYSCILSVDSARWTEPPGLLHSESDSELARLESKLRLRSDGTLLDFALAPLLRTGVLRLRNVPLRVYSNPAVEPRDYAGAFSPFLLREYVIEVDNSANSIRLHERAGWLPAEEPLVLPLLTLPRGAFIPLRLGEEQYWFHFDTGFSGTVGLSSSAIEAAGEQVQLLDTDSLEYHGWKNSQQFEELVIEGLSLPAYSTLAWARAEEISLGPVEGISFGEQYRELAGYRIGGIVGSGLLQQFNYALDFELSRMYVWERE